MNFIKNIYYSIIFIADSTYKNIFSPDKIWAVSKVIMTFAPIAFLLDTINLWFITNKQFIAGFLVVVLFNAWYGIKRHRKLGDFKWEIFLKKTREMLTLVISVYILLSILAKFAGDNAIAETFQVLIQVMTLFFPISKAIKSIHFLSGGEYPPLWMMKRFYGFEKDGNMKDLFDTENTKKGEETKEE